MDENQISRHIVDAAIAVHRELGPGLLESESADAPQSEPTVLRALLASGHADRYVFASGPLKGTTGYFERNCHDRVQVLHLFGRRLPRVRARCSSASMPCKP